MKRIYIVVLLLMVGWSSHGQININKIANKTKNELNKNKDKKKSENKSEDQKSGTEETTTTTTNSNTQQTNASTSTTTIANETSPGNQLAEKGQYYDRLRKFIDRYLTNTGTRSWDRDFLNYLIALDVERLEGQMKTDEATCGEYLMLYPKKIPTSGMGTITQSNLSEFTFARIADANAEPPASADGKLILNFYKEYCWWRYEIMTNKTRVVDNLKRSIQNAENAHIRQRFVQARLAKQQAEMAVRLLPGDMRIADLKDEAQRTYQSVVSGFGNMMSGNFHKTHLMEIVVFGDNLKVGSETESDLITTIIPGEPANITGYFAMTSKDAGGIPSLLMISPDNKYAKDAYPWGHGGEVVVPMFNGPTVVEKYNNLAYFTFNLFPDLATVNYKSHVQYMPHLNLIKWLRYLPSEIVEIPVRFGRNEEMALGRIRIDLSGDNKQKLEEYGKKLEAKRLAAVTFPENSGCTVQSSSVRNMADLNKYGKILKLTLAQTGDVMKPWPNDHEIDFHTAYGYAAVEKSDGRVEVMPLEFRKYPGESTWQWWSVGSWPDLYSIDESGTKVTAVRKIEHGYEILPENVKTCGFWYPSRR